MVVFFVSVGVCRGLGYSPPKRSVKGRKIERRAFPTILQQHPPRDPQRAARAGGVYVPPAEEGEGGAARAERMGAVCERASGA